MALDLAGKSQTIRARGEIIARLLNEAQTFGLKTQGNSGSPTATVGGALKNPKAYNAGFTNILTTQSTYGFGYGNAAGIRAGASWDNANSPQFYEQINSKPGINQMTDNTQYKDIVGFLTPVKLSDFLAQNNITRVTRLYNAIIEGGGNIAKYTLVDSSTLQYLNDSATFADYIVPIIEWFYTDTNGNRVKMTDLLFLYYFYTTTAFDAIKYSSQNLFGGTFYTYSPITVDIGGEGVGYFAFSPPYRHVSSIDFPQSLCASGFMLSGVLYENYPKPNREDRRVYLERTSAPYVVLGACSNASAVPSALARDLYYVNVEGISSPIGVKYYEGYDITESIPAYKDTQSIIDLFGDYGMLVTTDLDTALNPPVTDDGVINPDNPAEPMPFFPDNSSDETPIEGAYITPSNFAQSCVYNPLTTRDFLRWICDNTVDIGNWSRLFANPVDVITGINLYNLNIPAHDSAHTALQSETNILGVTTSIPNYAILDGYNNIIDGGTLTLEAYYGNYADFTSMTYQCFIPFVGFTSLRPCDVVNKRLHLFYAVDFATGAAVAFLNSDNKLIYTSPCTVAGKIPLSTSDKNSQMINNTLSVLGSVGGLLGGIASGNVGGGVGALLNGLGGLQMQTNYTNKGSLSAVNIYKLLPAFVERTRYDLFFPSDDQQYIGAKYQSAAGAPSTMFDTLVNCANAGGFVQSDVVYITSGTATETEKAEIAALIKSGIYL